MNRKFEAYVDEIENLAKEAILNFNPKFFHKDISIALDGSARTALNNTIPISRRRKEGVFFTSSGLAKKALKGIVSKIDNKTVFYDPACGAGDLLISCASALPVSKDFDTTIYEWGKKLVGVDLQPEFIRATKTRLFLAALSRFKLSEPKIASFSSRLFPLIRVGNGLDQVDSLKSASVIVVNPPYQSVAAPENCQWATGKVSSAALFIDHCVSNSLDNSRIVAILPDVLRSGSRYSGWRDYISNFAIVEKVDIVGRFDQWTDIDVFILHLRVSKKVKPASSLWQKSSSKKNVQLVGDTFDVHVGTVVPHRHKKAGDLHPYLIARDLPVWKTISKISSKRRFSGTVYIPPFVVVRRTSRPGDLNRTAGTIISGKKPVAVENHLMVLRPKDGELSSCRKLLVNLKREETSDWLDQRIRCRHLTVSALAELPWWENEQ